MPQSWDEDQLRVRDVLRALTTTILLLLNVAVWAPLVTLGGLLKLVTRGDLRRRVTIAAAHGAEGWVAWNDRIFDLMLPTQWDIRGVEGIRYDGRYLIISNHISWVDIFALYRAFHGHAAFIRFFLKSQLIWAPLIGQACWALDFPFMRRYSPEYLAHHPEKRGADLATTRRSLRRYRRIPVAILNFVEGTRFSREKQNDQDSPYRLLLRPRIGGIAFVLASMGEQLDAMFDVTLAYPGGDVTMWDFVTGRVPKIVIDVRRLEVSPEFFDAAITEPGPARDRFKAWMDEIWQAKDETLAKLVE
jgi:1-acyl-sn-glycerol-3-phosphate acyltransferase